jgi:hypothetical protein
MLSINIAPIVLLLSLGVRSRNIPLPGYSTYLQAAFCIWVSHICQNCSFPLVSHWQVQLLEDHHTRRSDHDGHDSEIQG